MVGFFLNQRPRRLPVFFVLDTSKAMEGTFQVTMQDGLLVVKSELAQYPAASEHVFLSEITFGEKTASQGLLPLEIFHPPVWQAEGQCYLKPALTSLLDALTFDLIVTRPNHPGDCAPLVFLILGSDPMDAWQEIPGKFTAFTDNRRPLIIILVTRPELVDKMKPISNHILLLQPAEAVHMTYFFFWVARAIAKICADSEDGATTIDFPDLPYGVVVPR